MFLAVKPDRYVEALQSIHAYWRESQCLISIVAGVSTEQLAFYLPAGGRVIRVMPNTPAMVGSSASALCLGEFATDEDRQRSLALMSAVGTADVVTEKMMDAVTGLSGSGPAYVYQFIEALSDGAVAAGLSRDLATKLAAQTVLGGARMVQETGLHPGILKDMVASPGGTTIEGLYALEKGALRATVMDAVRSATPSAPLLVMPRAAGVTYFVEQLTTDGWLLVAGTLLGEARTHAPNALGELFRAPRRLAAVAVDVAEARRSLEGPHARAPCPEARLTVYSLS